MKQRCSYIKCFIYILLYNSLVKPITENIENKIFHGDNTWLSQEEIETIIAYPDRTFVYIPQVVGESLLACAHEEHVVNRTSLHVMIDHIQHNIDIIEYDVALQAVTEALSYLCQQIVQDDSYELLLQYRDDVAQGHNCIYAEQDSATRSHKTKVFANVRVRGQLLTRYLRVLDDALIDGNLTVRGIITGTVLGGGNVVGPAVSALDSVPRFANTTGTLLDDSSVLIDNDGNITLAGITKDGNTVSWPTIVGAANTFLGSDGAGNLIYTTPGGAGNVDSTMNFTLDNAIIVVDLLNGSKNIKQSGVVIDADNDITGAFSITTSHMLISGFDGEAGVVHNDMIGLLYSTLIGNDDIFTSTIDNSKLATISSADIPGDIVVRDSSGNFATNMITIDGPVTFVTDVTTKGYVDAIVTEGFQQTWTILSALQSTVVSDFNQTMTVLANIESTVVNDFNQTMTVLSDITTTLDAFTGQVASDFQQTWTILGALNSTVVNDFNQTWTILADLTIPSITADFQQTWTILGALNSTVVNDFNQTWTILSGLQNTVVSDFNQTMTVLNGITTTLNTSTNLITTDFQQTWTILGALNSTVVNDFNQTWTILSTLAPAGTPITQAAVNAGTGGIANAYTILTPGNYYLAQDITPTTTPTASGTKAIIRIAANDVTLNLNGRNIHGTNATTNGIYIQTSFSNVVVYNGTVSKCALSGIVIDGGTTNITVNNCTATGCAFYGIQLGSDTIVMNNNTTGLNATTINDSTISNCKILNCATSNASLTALSALYGARCNNLIVDNCHVSDVSNTGFILTVAAAFFGGCSNSIFSNCTFNNNLWQLPGEINGFLLSGAPVASTNNKITNCTATATSNTSGGNKIIGLHLNHASGNLITNFFVSGNVASLGTVYGIFNDTSNYNIISQCQIANNGVPASTINATGIISSGGTGNVIDSCFITNNMVGQLVTGINLSGETNSTIQNCLIAGNVGSVSAAYCIELLSTCANCTVKNNTITDNVGLIAIFDSTNPSTSLFFGNNAFHNTAKGTSNYSVTYGATNVISTVTYSLSGGSPLPSVGGPFTNFDVTL